MLVFRLENVEVYNRSNQLMVNTRSFLGSMKKAIGMGLYKTLLITRIHFVNLCESRFQTAFNRLVAQVRDFLEKGWGWGRLS